MKDQKHQNRAQSHDLSGTPTIFRLGSKYPRSHRGHGATVQAAGPSDHRQALRDLGPEKWMGRRVAEEDNR